MWGTFSARTCSFILGPDWFSSPTFPQPIRCRCAALWWQILFFYTPHAFIDFFFCFYSLVFCSLAVRPKENRIFCVRYFLFPFLIALCSEITGRQKEGGEPKLISFASVDRMQAKSESWARLRPLDPIVRPSKVSTWLSTDFPGGVKCTVMRLAFPKHFRSLHCLNADQGFVASIWGKALEIG